MAPLHVHVDEHTFTASWLEKKSETQTAIEAALPIEGEATRWGDELYMRTSIFNQGENPAVHGGEDVTEGGMSLVV